MPAVLMDTGVWYAICDARDNAAPRERVEEIYQQIRVHQLLLPWPVAYEVLRTRFVRNRAAMERFERELRTQRIEFLNDEPYRAEALELSIGSSLRGNRPLSLVDCLMRLLLDDIDIRKQYFVTFNQRDFVDICARRRIELWAQ